MFCYCFFFHSPEECRMTLDLPWKSPGEDSRNAINLGSLMTVRSRACHPPPLTISYLPRLTIGWEHECAKIFYCINPLNYWRGFVVGGCCFIVVSLSCKYINLESTKIAREVGRRRAWKEKNNQWSRKRIMRQELS